MDQKLLQVHIIQNPSEFKQLEDAFWIAYDDPAQRDQLWLEWLKYFSTQDKQNDRIVLHSYLRWYTQLTWQKWQLLKRVEIVDAFERQIWLAIQLGFDPIDKLLSYCIQWSNTDEESMELFSFCKKSLLESSAYLGEINGKVYTIKDIVTRMNNKKMDSFGRSQLYKELVNFVGVPTAYQAVVQHFPFFSSEECVNNFIDVVTFFQDTKKNDLPDILLHLEHDDWYELLEKDQERVVQELKNSGQADIVLTPHEFSNQPISDVFPKTTEIIQEVATPKKPNFLNQLQTNKTPLAWMQSDEGKSAFLTWAQDKDKKQAKQSVAKELKKQMLQLTEEHIQKLLDLDTWFQSQGYTEPDLIFFDETTTSFQWNI
ncbi:hypothetical protein KKG22_02490 [Patescibacteria group bacterium]|nr:hypothetical protein [Patescibacteria group bacterium]MBU1722170.1 hypothetical protein [Patescibacteria group bacterium]MBU1901121.1 hypothetical protein [Patescibacteria group bacterium]